MVKISPRQADAFVAAPDAAVRAVLIYGADRGMVRERAVKLGRTVVEDLADPFRVAELDAGALAKEPARLFDEAAAIALSGGRRVVSVRDATDRLAGVFDDFLGTPVGDALVVVEAGELSATSKLRKSFEKSPQGAAIACYRDEGRDLMRVIGDELGALGLSADRDALGLMASYLGGDRLLTRSELGKLAVYMGDGRDVTVGDVETVLADGSFLSHERISQAVLGGRVGDLERALDRALAERENPVAIMGSVRREIQRLELFLGLLAAGGSPDSALRQMRLDPRRQFRIVEPLRAAGNVWRRKQAKEALSRLLEADLLAKSSGYPAETVCRQTLLAIAARAGRGRRAA
jgi:DNA polymerase-3 subunit delta